MIISIASGKGGTGKTTVAVNLAIVLGSSPNGSQAGPAPTGVQFIDADVEVVSPAALRTEIADEIRKMTRIYPTGDTAVEIMPEG